MLLSFSAKESNQRKLPAAPGSMKVSAFAWPVLPEPANAGFLGYLRFVGWTVYPLVDRFQIL
jgi:hypothetical protein